MKKGTVILILLTLVLNACGLVRSLRSSEKQTQTDQSQIRVTDFKAFENFSANIPASHIKSIKLPSGTEIVLRDSIPDPKPRVVDTTATAPEKEEPSITFSYESGVEKKDSADTKVTESVQETVEKETEVKSGSGLTWLFVGIGVGLAAVIALYIYRPW